MIYRLISFINKNLSYILVALTIFVPASFLYVYSINYDNTKALSTSIMFFTGGFLLVYVLKNIHKERIKKWIDILF